MKKNSLIQSLVRVLFLVSMVLIVFSSCRKDRMLITGSEALLSFSVDTLRFDTVFTELGSATQILKVYNPHDLSIQIDKIFIESGSNSKFRINIDGVPGNTAEDLIIEPNDSLYIFAEVTVNPDEPVSLSPFVLEDGLRFETSGNEQRVQLEAWGQNAIYLPNRFNKGGVALLSCDLQEEVWTDSLPYVIYGILVIDSCTLVLEPGTRIYMHGGVARTVDEMNNVQIYNDGLIYSFAKGNIHIEGTYEEPVIIQGDRLEESFQQESGQWVGMRLGGTDNVFQFAEVRNSLIGVLVDSAASLEIDQSKIYNTSGAGLIGIHSQINANNCLFYNNGGNSVQLGYGGVYDFNYCSVASFGVDAAALSLSNGICYDAFCQEFDIYPLEASFRNSIIYGSRKDEVSLSDFTGGMEPDFYQISFSDCIVRVEDLLDPDKGGYPNFFEDFCTPCLNAGQTAVVFADPNEDDYHLDTLSIAEELAIPIPGLDLDLDFQLRDSEKPDVGCYEYQYQ
ncbi:MAG: hypothetical protein KDC34_02325 [Saprospiraceae bacterium]|nr:hypothetical protein [Saprospiraceae bacterium]